MKKKTIINALPTNPLWYKEAVIYQLHVKSFYDSEDDGIGDFSGLIQKLDYLRDLGVTALWLLPFYPSPLRDDGYDISNYVSIHPNYGSLGEFKMFLKEAHNKGMRVITELVLNHTSDEHPWFRKERQLPSEISANNFYVWSDNPQKYKEARVIFKDFEISNWTWDPYAKAYYWHRFYWHQPDLNFENPRVQREILKILDFWFNLGVDGLRLDAVPYLFEKEGTNCENLPETFAYLKKLRQHVDSKHKDKMLLAEANQWTEDAVLYFGNDDMCHMAFHFPLMPRMYMALHMEEAFPLIDILEQTPPIPTNSQWALFLRNHDELTLEMVTDEERDYMYRVYARDTHARINFGIRRRLAPLLGNERRRIELMNVLLFSLPGTPVIYYGDEIGMGDNYYLGDRNGVRTPMQWNAEKNSGFSKASPQKLFLPVIIESEYHYEVINVENQERNYYSLLWWMRRVIAKRKQYKAFSYGSIELVKTNNPRVLSFIRNYGDETILIIMNLSRFSQVADLELSRYAGMIPEDMFSHNKFPVIKDSPYVFSLGIHGYFWFILRKEKQLIIAKHTQNLSCIDINKDLAEVFAQPLKSIIESEILPSFLITCRWFSAKGRNITEVNIVEALTLSDTLFVFFLDVIYTEGIFERYLLPVSFAFSQSAATVLSNFPTAVIARVKVAEQDGVMYDGLFNDEFRHMLIMLVGRQKKIRGIHGDLEFFHEKRFIFNSDLVTPSETLKSEQSNTSILYNKQFILKLYRKLEEGINPDVEIPQKFTECPPDEDIIQVSKIVPPFLGGITYKPHDGDVVYVGNLQGFCEHQEDGWSYMLNHVRNYLDKAIMLKEEAPPVSGTFLDVEYQRIPPVILELTGVRFFDTITLLARRTAQLHERLYKCSSHPDFRPEPFSPAYQRSLYQSMQSQCKRTFALLRNNLDRMHEAHREALSAFIGYEKGVLDKFKAILRIKIGGVKIRIHGDYHLGQVLWTGNDFVIIDFEGEPLKPLSERRLKRSPLRDVAGMIRSFHYALYAVIENENILYDKQTERLQKWADNWYHYTSGIFLESYLKQADEYPFVTKNRDEIETLLGIFILNKAVYELEYETNNRPDWIIVPLKGIKQILNIT